MLLNIEPEWWLSYLYKAHLYLCKEHTHTMAYNTCKEHKQKSASLEMFTKFVNWSHFQGTVYYYISEIYLSPVNFYAKSVVKIMLS